MRLRRLFAIVSSIGLAASMIVPVAGAAELTSGGLTPLLRAISGHFASAPTTADCVAQVGLACYSPQQFQTAYDLAPLYARGLTGRGKTIVLVDSFGSPTIGADLATFDRTFRLPPPPRFVVLQPEGPVPAFNLHDPIMVGWAQETSLDVEYAHAMAPGADILLVETPVAETEGLVGIPQIVAAENYVINHHLGDVISQSFGASERSFGSTPALLGQRSAFINAAAQKVTVLACSGDAGASDPKNADSTVYYTRRSNSWPSTDPLVTSVGGTQLHLNAQGQRLQPDNGWNDTALIGSPAASGGGLSTVFARPRYQNGVRDVVGSHRGTPDVSMTAAVNGAALVYLGFESQPGFFLVGGTSESTPMFAGIVAIADQAAGHDLGLLNPALYALAAKRAAGLPDVTAGDNTVSFTQRGRQFTVQGFEAGPGYDLVSGLGTIDGAKLVDELAGHRDGGYRDADAGAGAGAVAGAVAGADAGADAAQ